MSKRKERSGFGGAERSILPLKALNSYRNDNSTYNLRTSIYQASGYVEVVRYGKQ